MDRRENGTHAPDRAPESRDPGNPTDSGISRTKPTNDLRFEMFRLEKPGKGVTFVTELIENSENRGNLYTTYEVGERIRS